MRKRRGMIAKNATRAAGLRQICKKIGGRSYFRSIGGNTHEVER